MSRRENAAHRSTGGESNPVSFDGESNSLAYFTLSRPRREARGKPRDRYRDLLHPIRRSARVNVTQNATCNNMAAALKPFTASWNPRPPPPPSAE